MAEHLILIRSGPTDYEVQGRIRGTLDIPLAPAGIAAAERAALLLARRAAPGAGAESAPQPPLAAVYAAADSACNATARIIGQALGVKPRTATDLGNLDQGLWQGLLVDDIRTKQPRLHRQWVDNPWAIAPPEGESLDDATARLEQALEMICRRHGSGRVAVVVSPPIDRLILWLVAGEPLGDLWCTSCPENTVAELPLAAQWKGARQRVPVG
jgi:broad specificity phosphatase PhoE